MSPSPDSNPRPQPYPADALLQAPTLWALVQRRVALSPQTTMLIDADSGQHWSFAQVAQAAEGLAAYFLAQGIGPGTPVTWQIPTSVAALVTALALARLGAVQSPIISLYREAEVRPVLERSRSDFYIVPEAGGGRDFPAMAQALRGTLAQPPVVLVLPGILPQADPASLPPPPQDGRAATWVYYTSGTTSEPKGALHCDDALMIGGRNQAWAMQITAADVGSITFPYAHIAGAIYTTMILATGMSALVLSRFVPGEAMALMARYKVSLAGGSTPHYQAFLAEQRKQPHQRLLPHLRLLAGGGAPKPPELYFDLKRAMGIPIIHCYGMTEVPLNVAGCICHTDEQLAYSDGQPVEHVEVRIAREDDSSAEVGEVGEVRVRGRGVCLGYTDPEVSRRAFDGQGWFRTGDLGRLRPDGHLALTGRLKDIIIRKGENISAKELEDLLYTHPKVAAVAVIGLPDPERGERVCAVVELRDPARPLTFAELVQFFEDAHVMRQKIPEQLEIVAPMPRNETLNKILKHVLRDRFAAKTPTCPGVTP